MQFKEGREFLETWRSSDAGNPNIPSNPDVVQMRVEVSWREPRSPLEHPEMVGFTCETALMPAMLAAKGRLAVAQYSGNGLCLGNCVMSQVAFKQLSCSQVAW